MGCGTSKSVQTIENDPNSVQNGTVVNKDSVKVMNGTNGKTTSATGSRRMSRPMTPDTCYKNTEPKDIPQARTGVLCRARQTLNESSISLPKPVAFDIPLDDPPVNSATDLTEVVDSNIPKRLPPKRLLALTEQSTNQLTAKQLTEKQLKAEEKRLEILEERKLKAHKYNEKFLSNNNQNNSETKSNNSQEAIGDNIKNEENVSEINSSNNTTDN